MIRVVKVDFNEQNDDGTISALLDLYAHPFTLVDGDGNGVRAMMVSLSDDGAIAHFWPDWDTWRPNTPDTPCPNPVPCERPDVCRFTCGPEEV